MDQVALAERTKYLQVWNHPSRGYHAYSPGAEEAPRAVAWFRSLSGLPLDVHTVADYGCGAGAALPILDRAFGYVWAIDVAPVCEYRSWKKINFIEAPLWGLPSHLQSDFSFSCDVLEHIPPERLDLSIAAIAARTRLAGLIRVGTNPDGFGPRLIGKRLHLVVQNAEWWQAELAKHFASVSVDRIGPNFATFKVMGKC